MRALEMIGVLLKRTLSASIAIIAFSGTDLAAQCLASGPQILTFFSDVDDTEQPYCIYLPKNFDEQREYPLVVMLHGAGSNHRLAMRRVFGKSNLPGENDVEASLYFPEWRDVDMIVAAPYARGTSGYQGIMEKDVLDMMADIKSRFRIDENRTYLTGLSMGGGGTLWLGLSSPDLWAAIAPVCPAPPPGSDELAPNALNMAVRFVHGTEDQAVPVKVSRDWVATLRQLGTPKVEYEEYPGVDHWSWVQAYAGGRVFDWLSQFVRDPWPQRVRHASIDLRHAAAYWVEITQKEVGETALVDARYTGRNQMQVDVNHVLAFVLDLEGHPMHDPSGPVSITVNGSVFEIPAGGSEAEFVLSSGQWIRGGYQPERVVRSAFLEGPVSKACNTRHLYVFGTADSPSDEEVIRRREIALKAADWSVYRGEFLGRVKIFPRVVPDRDVRPSDLAGGNLVLFGTPETNLLIREMQDQLPITLDERKAKKYGLVYVFPNQYGHLVMINSGLPWWESETIEDVRFQSPVHTILGNLKDYRLFSKNQKTLIEGYFDETWRLPEQARSVLSHQRAVTVVED